MRRRDVLAALAGAAAWPTTARAQQAALPVLGYLGESSPEEYRQRLAAFQKGLNEAGFVEGRNVAVEYLWANGRIDRLPALVGELVRRRVAVISGSTNAALAAKAATKTIPIVFATGGDPVGLGFVASLSRPEANVTGATSMNADVAAKRLAVFRELVPSAARYVALVNPASVMSAEALEDLENGASSLGIRLEILRASNEREIDAAFAGLRPSPGTVMVFGPDAYLYSRRAQIAALASRYAIPTMFDVREYVQAGGLVSYGGDYLSVLRLAGGYVGRILAGEKPAELPVARSTKFELVINLKTARTVGVVVPSSLLAQADDVIE